MDYLKFTDLKNHAKEYFDKIEKGLSYIITKNGKPIAQITPFINKSAGWKRQIQKIRLRQKANSLDYILKERYGK